VLHGRDGPNAVEARPDRHARHQSPQRVMGRRI